MVGEIRDIETAEIAIKAAQTGHLVMSTLHTNDAPSTPERLKNMGVAPFNIASSVILITAQRPPAGYARARSRSTSPQALVEAGFEPEDLDGSWQPMGGRLRALQGAAATRAGWASTRSCRSARRSPASS